MVERGDRHSGAQIDRLMAVNSFARFCWVALRFGWIDRVASIFVVFVFADVMTNCFRVACILAKVAVAVVVSTLMFGRCRCAAGA